MSNSGLNNGNFRALQILNATFYKNKIYFYNNYLYLKRYLYYMYINMNIITLM